MDSKNKEFDPERILLGLSHYELTRSHDWSSLQQPNVIGYEYDFDCSSQHNHADVSGGF